MSTSELTPIAFLNRQLWLRRNSLVAKAFQPSRGGGVTSELLLGRMVVRASLRTRGRGA